MVNGGFFLHWLIVIWVQISPKSLLLVVTSDVQNFYVSIISANVGLNQGV